MARNINELGLFKAKPSKAESKADVTNHTARAIIGDEVSRREAKTAKLRQARLDKEAELASQPPPEKPAPKKAPARRVKAQA